MSPLLIQTYLRTHGGAAAFPKLLTEFGITAKQSDRHPSLWLLKYDQIASPLGEPMVRECRGIILDEADDWEVVSFPFTKFFNYGEGHAAEIDWSTASVQEKLDGSLAVLYWYGGRWNMQTSGSPDASGNVHGNDVTFHEYFWQLMGALPEELDTNSCWFFEICGPWNRIVVPYSTPELTILGGRNLVTGQEYTPAYVSAQFRGMKFVRTYPLQSIADVLGTLDRMNPLQQEGYVVCDAAFNRIKVKCPAYVALHHAKDGMTEKAFIDIARRGEVSEIVAAFPEFESMLNDARNRVSALVTAVATDFRTITEHVGPEATQKEFAAQAVLKPYSAALFALRAGKSPDAAHYVANAPQSWVLKVLEVQP